MNNNESTNQTHPLITADHLRRSAIIYLRQSTERQVRDNTGSTDFQRGLAEVARSYGWQDAQIEIIDEDLGRSGSSSERRTGWQRLQLMIAAKQVGAVFVANISRLSRQVLDFEVFRLLSAAHNTLLYTDGRLIDLANSNDTIVSQITAMVAHFENRKRTEIMSQARRIKAQQGVVVSTLPVGWIETPGGRYDYDPETKDTIRVIIETFLQTRSLRRTALALENAGIQIPSRHGQLISFKKPNLNRVRLILVHPAYAGTYVYGRTQSPPGAPVLANGQSKREKVPEERWIKVFNHHPAYMTQEQQEEVKSILSGNGFTRRYRAGRGPALFQGLLRCELCKRRLNVTYRGNKSYSYRCAWEIRRCIRFTSCELEQYILTEVFKVLEAPPLEMLKAALEESRSQERSRLEWIESERERLAHEERIARDRAELSHGSLRRVHLDALEKLEEVLADKERFEQKLAVKALAPANRELEEEELEELGQLVSEVPSLWHHPAVTNQERKEILRCIIGHIVVAATQERIDAMIFWKSGGQTSFSMWRGKGQYNLIRELHAQRLTTSEIQEHLATGRTSTGQVINLRVNRIGVIQHMLGLKPNRFSARNISLAHKAAELNRNGQSLEWIAQYFNQQGFPSTRGKSWTRRLVYELIARIGKKVETLGNLHRGAIIEARARGLTYRQMAIAFNERNIRRKGGLPWTALNVANTCSKLDLLQHDLKEGSTGTDAAEPPIVRRSA